MKYLIVVITIVLLVFLLFGFAAFSGLPILSDFLSSPGLDGREVLLDKTDFPELLKAGREIISKAESGEYKEEIAVYGKGWFNVPIDVNVPEYIQTISKKFDNINGLGWAMNVNKNEYLEIFFDGERETGHFGIHIYPEDINEPVNTYSDPEDIMIMPGMWYFDDAYYQFPKLRKENTNRIKKNKSLKKR